MSTHRQCSREINMANQGKMKTKYKWDISERIKETAETKSSEKKKKKKR